MDLHVPFDGNRKENDLHDEPEKSSYKEQEDILLLEMGDIPDYLNCDILDKKPQPSLKVEEKINNEISTKKDFSDVASINNIGKSKEILANDKDVDMTKIHIDRSYKAPEKVTCEHCGKEIKASNIQIHINRQHGKFSEFKCPMCQKVFNRRHSMNNHLHNVHKEEKCVCEVCSKTFNNRQYLKIHIKTTHDTTATECPTCKKVFGKKHLMQAHKRVLHEGEKSVCDKCSKTFESRKYLLWHIRRNHKTA